MKNMRNRLMYYLNNKKMKISSIVTGILTSYLLASTPVALAEGMWVSLEKTGGSGVFQEKCGMCHREGGMGTGILARRLPADQSLLENRLDLKGPFIQTVVRNGFGVMFPISRAEVSDAQLDTIIDYLVVED